MRYKKCVKKYALFQFSGSSRALADAFLRLVYNRPVASRPILDLSLNNVREGFMDLVLDAAADLERRSWRSILRGNRYLKYRKFIIDA